MIAAEEKKRADEIYEEKKRLEKIYLEMWEKKEEENQLKFQDEKYRKN